MVSVGFPQRLRELRQQTGFLQVELAKKVGMHQNQIGRYERGSSHPSGDAIKKLADVLGVSADYLLEGSTEDAARADFEDRELLRMFKEVERFDAQDKDVIKALIDAFIKKKQLVALAGNDTQRQVG
ncbi:MAG: helix-turn-helix transcriptional regulator [Myxococcota bacterium]